MNQVVSMGCQNPRQPRPVFVLHNLRNGSLNLPVVKQPLNRSLPKLMRPGGVGVANPMQQCTPKQVVVTEPLVMIVQRNQKQVLRKQAFKHLLAVVSFTN